MMLVDQYITGVARGTVPSRFEPVRFPLDMEMDMREMETRKVGWYAPVEPERDFDNWLDSREGRDWIARELERYEPLEYSAGTSAEWGTL